MLRATGRGHRKRTGRGAIPGPFSLGSPPPWRQDIAEPVGGARDPGEAGVAQAVAVVEGDGAEAVAVADDQGDGGGARLGRRDRPAQDFGRGRAVADGDKIPAGAQSGLIGQTAPEDAADAVGAAEGEAEGVAEIIGPAGPDRFLGCGQAVDIDQAVTTAGEAVQRGAGVGADGVQPIAQEAGPVMRVDRPSMMVIVPRSRALRRALVIETPASSPEKERVPYPQVNRTSWSSGVTTSASPI